MPYKESNSDDSSQNSWDAILQADAKNKDSFQGSDNESDYESEDESEDESVDESVPGETEEETISFLFRQFAENDNIGLSENFDDAFVYKNDLPPYYIAAISLMKILSEHRGTDLSLFDRIFHWVGHFSDNYPDIWKNRQRQDCHSRETILKLQLNCQMDAKYRYQCLSLRNSFALLCKTKKFSMKTT